MLQFPTKKYNKIEAPYAPSNKKKKKNTKQNRSSFLHSTLCWKSPSKPSWEVTQVSQTQSVGIQLPAPFEYLYDNFAAKVGDIFLSEVDVTAVHTVFRESHCKYSIIISILLMRDAHLYKPTP